MKRITESVSLFLRNGIHIPFSINFNFFRETAYVIRFVNVWNELWKLFIFSETEYEVGGAKKLVSEMLCAPWTWVSEKYVKSWVFCAWIRWVKWVMSDLGRWMNTEWKWWVKWGKRMECGSHYSECEEKMVIFGGTGESFGVQGEPPFRKTCRPEGRKYDTPRLTSII